MSNLQTRRRTLVVAAVLELQFTKESDARKAEPDDDGSRFDAGQDRHWRIVGAAIAAFALLALIMGASAFAFTRLRPAQSADRPSESWAVAAPRSIARTVAATGSVRLKTGSTVRIGSQLSGIVERLFVTVGSHVQRGDVIAEIDSRPIEAKIDQQRAQVVRKEVLAAKAKADLRRLTPLAQKGWVSGQRFDDAKADAEGASASLAAAREDLRAASVDLNYVKIRAPISGIVASVSTQPGETVAASFATPTFVTIIQPDALEVVALVDEADIGGVRVGQPADFTVESWPDRDFHGQVVRIAPGATTISGVINYEVAIRIDSELDGLRPDMTANVTITTARSTVVSVPAAAVRRTAAGTVVAVRSKTGRPILRRVRAGQTRSGMIDIASGLGAGEEVLIQAGGNG